MNRRTSLRQLSAAALLATTSWARSEVFLTEAQAQALLFPGKKLTPAPITLTDRQKKAIASASGVRVRSLEIKAWRTASGECLFIDNVVGKHEFIDFALALDKDGAVKGVEVLTYRESYGAEVRQPKWRQQFSGKTIQQPVKIDKDIQNISGATLSSVHITDGVRRLLHTWNIAVRGAS